MGWKLREYSIYHQNGVKISFTNLINIKPLIFWFFPEDEEYYLEIVEFNNELKKHNPCEYQIIGICRTLPGNNNHKLINLEENIILISDFDGTLTNVFNVVFFENTIEFSRPIIQKSIFLLSSDLNIKKEFRSKYQEWDLSEIQREIYYGLKNYSLQIK
ncbi:hypothetical protein [Spiroplasma alleghenense]|uniref:Peroxiredoxin Q/BCP n=1 Tax=Spiroplasma alleghenense TaxID=216931 RepID=A0A345Z319_9MOLU|nr:hypothetical protein [Spiroplasma alleghenense]AXK50998.1 peroxiredoxin Q/BCP [Spiroplasma alleghenense]